MGRHSAPRLALLALCLVMGCFEIGSCSARQIVRLDFEYCERCGVIVEQGTAAPVSVLHPGEHALRMSGTTVVSTPWTPDFTRSTDSLDLVARCESGSQLVIEEQVRACDQPGSEQSTGLALTIPGDDTWRHYAQGLSRMATPRQSRVDVRLRFATSGAANCFVDDVSLVNDPGPMQVGDDVTCADGRVGVLRAARRGLACMQSPSGRSGTPR